MKKWGAIGVLTIVITFMLTSVRVSAATAADYTDMELLERVVEAEAGNQGLIGKRLVVSVIYNRVDSEKFPDTIREVLTSPHQFGPVWNGAIHKVNVSDETRAAIMFETVSRLDTEILYFNSGEVSGKYAYTYKGHKFGK